MEYFTKMKIVPTGISSTSLGCDIWYEDDNVPQAIRKSYDSQTSLYPRLPLILACSSYRNHIVLMTLVLCKCTVLVGCDCCGILIDMKLNKQIKEIKESTKLTQCNRLTFHEVAKYRNVHYKCWNNGFQAVNYPIFFGKTYSRCAAVHVERCAMNANSAIWSCSTIAQRRYCSRPSVRHRINQSIGDRLFSAAALVRPIQSAAATVLLSIHLIYFDNPPSAFRLFFPNISRSSIFFSLVLI